jgi:hypothetical protein
MTRSGPVTRMLAQPPPAPPARRVGRRRLRRLGQPDSALALVQRRRVDPDLHWRIPGRAFWVTTNIGLRLTVKTSSQ